MIKNVFRTFERRIPSGRSSFYSSKLCKTPGWCVAYGWSGRRLRDCSLPSSSTSWLLDTYSRISSRKTHSRYDVFGQCKIFLELCFIALPFGLQGFTTVSDSFNTMLNHFQYIKCIYHSHTYHYRLTLLVFVKSSGVVAEDVVSLNESWDWRPIYSGRVCASNRFALLVSPHQSQPLHFLQKASFCGQCT